MTLKSETPQPVSSRDDPPEEYFRLTAPSCLSGPSVRAENARACAVLRLVSRDGTNRLLLARVNALFGAVCSLYKDAEAGLIKALIITGNEKFFSAGADLNEIVELRQPDAFDFAKTGQRLMLAVDRFPAPVIAAVQGYCMGGGLDLALACDYRVAAPNAVLGHRGASLGLITGWGGTQRLPRLIGKSRAQKMFLLGEKVEAEEAKRIGLVDEIAEEPIAAAYDFLKRMVAARVET
jgi:enoyl-CoA hydratase/carnithine racemase